MNRSAGRSTAGVRLAYSLTRGPVALNSMSIPPASCATDWMYASTAGSSKTSMTSGRARPPAATISLATTWRGLLAPAGQEHLSALGRERFRHLRADRTAGAEHDCALALQQRIRRHVSAPSVGVAALRPAEPVEHVDGSASSNGAHPVEPGHGRFAIWLRSEPGTMSIGDRWSRRRRAAWRPHTVAHDRNRRGAATSAEAC